MPASFDDMPKVGDELEAANNLLKATMTQLAALSVQASRNAESSTWEGRVFMQVEDALDGANALVLQALESIPARWQIEDRAQELLSECATDEEYAA